MTKTIIKSKSVNTPSGRESFILNVINTAIILDSAIHTLGGCVQWSTGIKRAPYFDNKFSVMASPAVRGVLTFLCTVFLLSTSGVYSDPDIQDDYRFQHQMTTKGRKFVFAFLDNCIHEHEDVITGPKLTITAPPDASDIVTVNISMPYLEFFVTVAVSVGGIATVQLPYTTIADSSGLNYNGILVAASDDVFINGIAEEDRHGRSEGFLALPVPETNPSGHEYVAVAFDMSKKNNSRRHSMFAAVGVAPLSTVYVDLTADVMYNDVTYQAGSTLQVNVSEYEVLQLKSLGDLTGTRVRSTTPLGFMSGMDCTTMKLRHGVRSGCGHMIEQLPSTDAWGKDFIYQPLTGGPNTRQPRRQQEPADDVITRIKILEAEGGTSVLIRVGDERLVTDRSFDVTGSETVHITAFKPVMVMAFILYHGACENGCKKRSPMMTTIQPLSPPARDVIFSTVNATDRSERSAINHYLSVMYDCGCFRRLAWEQGNQSVISQAGFAGISDKICWNQFQVPAGQYHFSSGPSDDGGPCFLSALLFGHGTHGGYAFPLGLAGELTDQPDKAPTSAIGSVFYIAFATYFWQDQRGPRLSIHRALSTEDDMAIQGSVTSGSYSDTFTIPVGQQSIELELPASIMLTNSRDESRQGVEVRTLGHVMVYGLNDALESEGSDAFLALPEPMLGREYRLVTSYVSLVQPSPFAMFVIIGTQDNTFVSLQLKGSLSFRNHVHYGGTSVGFTINRNQAIFFLAYEDHTGTHVLSDKPVSVLSGATCGFSLFPDVNFHEGRHECSHHVEHLPPVDRWGRTFMTSTLLGFDGGSVMNYVMTSDVGNSIQINDRTEIRLQPGHTYSVMYSEYISSRLPEAIIRARKPVLVYQVSNDLNSLTHTSEGSSLPTFTLVPPLDELEGDNTAPLSTHIPVANFKLPDGDNTANYATIVARCSHWSNVTLNGESLPPWYSLLEDTEFCMFKTELDSDTSYVVNSDGTKVSAIFYGFSPSYAYSCPGSL